MAMFVRAKRVSDPLTGDAKARIRGDDVSVVAGYASSGSEHNADDPLFSCPLHADQLVEWEKVADFDFDVDANIDTIRRLFDACNDPFVLRLRSDVARASTDSGSTGLDKPTHRRAVMAMLREYGYNAGVCKAEWGTSGSSLTAGSYEYIDVVVPGSGRYVVDLWFAAEFEVARATEGYAALVAALPRVVVARGEEVGKAVRAMAEAARRSMKSKGLHLPPWRKRRYMMAKWFRPYRRTVGGAVPAAAVRGGEVIKCRTVGFVSATPERGVGLTTGTR